MDRKSFLKKSLTGSVFLTTPALLFSQDEPAVFNPEEIQALVFAAHKDLDETRKLLDQNPHLINCTNQRKRGDFETAMGGASHMGRRDIADLLISRGARLDIFNYTFLGYDDFVKKVIEDYPHLLNAPGPHGFTLLHHANAGSRTKLADWFRAKGLTETHFKGAFS